MAIRTIYPTKNATLYEDSGSKNTGLDEILELEKSISASGLSSTKNTRMLLQFDTSTLSASLSALGINTASDSGSLTWNLKLFVSEEIDIPETYNIVAHPMRESWTAGLGKRYHNPTTTEGVSWLYRTGKTPEVLWTGGNYGGYFWSGSHASQSATQEFSGVQGDIDIDVTNIVESWHTNTITNTGFIVKRSGSEETSTTQLGITRYYSKNTNTIYPPRLIAKWDNTPARSTGSMTELGSNDDIKVEALLTPEYKQDTETRVEVIAQPRFPTRTQTDAVGTITRYALPASSSYAIIDNATGEVVIDHDTVSTLIACSGNKHYIDINFAGLFPERYYKLQVKVPDLLYTNSVQYFNVPTVFKVIK